MLPGWREACADRTDPRRRPDSRQPHRGEQVPAAPSAALSAPAREPRRGPAAIDPSFPAPRHRDCPGGQLVGADGLEGTGHGARAIRWGDRPSASWPSRTSGAVALKAAEAIDDDGYFFFPPPSEPWDRSARRRPASTRTTTSSTAVRPRYRFVRPLTCSSAASWSRHPWRRPPRREAWSQPPTRRETAAWPRSATAP